MLAVRVLVVEGAAGKQTTDAPRFVWATTDDEGTLGRTAFHQSPSSLSIEAPRLQQLICHLACAESKQRASSVIGPHPAPQDKLSLHHCQVGSEVKRDIGRAPLY